MINFINYRRLSYRIFLFFFRCSFFSGHYFYAFCYPSYSNFSVLSPQGTFPIHLSLVLILFLVVVILFLLHRKNLLMSLIMLEILRFFILYFTSFSLSPVLTSDFLLLAIFSVFVIEGVIALSGLITLVTFVGSDYVRASTFIKL